MFKFLFVIFFFFILLVFLMGFSILRTFKNIFLVAETALVRENNVVKQIAILPDIVLRLLPPGTMMMIVHLMCTVRRYSPRMKGSMWITRKLNRA